jgi:transcriptional coactivator p15 (PC4)
MWINPNHPSPPRQAAAPRETGQRVATFARHGGEELRVNLAEYEGHPYLSLRVWAPGQDGQLWPVRGKGLSVKLREVASLAEVLTDVAGRLGTADRHEGNSDRSPIRDQARLEKRRGSVPPPFEPRSASTSGCRPGFDEC